MDIGEKQLIKALKIEQYKKFLFIMLIKLDNEITIIWMIFRYAKYYFI